MTWAEVFERLGVTRCGGCPQFADYHRHGYMVGNVMHWSDRRVTRPGLYKLLRKIAWGQNTILQRFPLWQQVYLLNQEVLELAKRAGVRLPRPTFDLDRARLRFALSEYTAADQRRMTPSEQREFRAARRWAARS